MIANKYRKGIRNSSTNAVNQAAVKEVAKGFRMTEREARWGGAGGAEQATAVHGRAGLGRVG